MLKSAVTSSSSSFTRLTTSVDLQPTFLRDDRVFEEEAEVVRPGLSPRPAFSCGVDSPFSLPNPEGDAPPLGFDGEELGELDSSIASWEPGTSGSTPVDVCHKKKAYVALTTGMTPAFLNPSTIT